MAERIDDRIDEKTYDSKMIQTWGETEDEELTIYMLLTSNRHQMGKTSCAMRLLEKVEEEVHGRKFDVRNNLGFDNDWLLERRHHIGNNVPLIPDEPERIAGNRAWQSEENQIVAETLMAEAYQHKHVLFPLPHTHLLDNAIAGICTSQAVIGPKGHLNMFALERDQLNRNFKTRTYRIGDAHFDKPWAWDWKIYIEMREEYTIKRGKILQDNLSSLRKEASVQTAKLTEDQILELITANPRDYSAKEGGDPSPSVVKVKLKVPFSKAQHATTAWKVAQRELLAAEKNA